MATLLLIDDSDSQRETIRAALEGVTTFKRVLEARDGLEGLSLLVREPVDVVLCDLAMPKLDGDKLLRMKDANPGGANIPFVFLTGSADPERRARLISSGAADAIAKPFHPGELLARLQLHLKVKRLQDELMLKNAALAQLSSVDALTGLRARRFLDEILNVEFLRARRYRTPLAVVMADLDHFKRINDGSGHPAGDHVLRELGAIFLSMVRRTDVAGRYGGEEFLVIHPQSTATGAAHLAERLRHAVEIARFDAEGVPLRVTLSLGVAEYDRRMASPRDLIAAADRALYAAKRGGRNRVMVAAEKPERD
ncbi:MAG TPA: diguanylate cyclase [Myxococcota bacterium]|nr:diguanylate cyclase [Myxococcota bacterium]